MRALSGEHFAARAGDSPADSPGQRSGAAECPPAASIPAPRSPSPAPSPSPARPIKPPPAAPVFDCDLQVRLPPSLARSRTAPIPIPKPAPVADPGASIQPARSRPRSPPLLATSLPAAAASSPLSPLRPRSSLPPGSLKSPLSPTTASSAPSKPATSVLAFDANIAKSHVNERAARKIMDLEIANESLLAVNNTLENTIREQALNLEQMRRMMGVLKRKYGETILSFDLDSTLGNGGIGSADDSASNSGTFVESVSPNLSKSASFVRQKFDPFSNSVIEEIDISPELQKEVEQQFSRVCDTISQLIEEGEKALKTSFKAKPLVPDIDTLSPSACNTQNAFLGPQDEVPQGTTSPSTLSPPTTILSSSPSKSKPIVARSKLTPMTNQIVAMGNTTNNNENTRTSTLKPQSTPEAMDVMYKKARMLITARRAYTRQKPSTESDLAAMDAQISSMEMVEVPLSLYTAFAEVIDGVHEDLAESREHQQRMHQQQLLQQKKASATGGAIVAGGFAINVGGAGSAVVVGVGSGDGGMTIKEFRAMATPSAMATAALASNPRGAAGGANADLTPQRRRTSAQPSPRRANGSRPESPLQRGSVAASHGPALGSRVFSTQRRSLQNLRKEL
ncbi:hypothetical protein HDU82_008017 [Entophlyctis luteolus]|nr:hypothetical protein HDU82_008017 [Entophlyctis luteolus]